MRFRDRSSLPRSSKNLRTLLSFGPNWHVKQGKQEEKKVVIARQLLHLSEGTRMRTSLLVPSRQMINGFACLEAAFAPGCPPADGN